MICFLFVVYAALAAVTIYQLRPKPPPAPPRPNKYDYGDKSCDGIGWD